MQLTQTVETSEGPVAITLDKVDKRLGRVRFKIAQYNAAIILTHIPKHGWQILDDIDRQPIDADDYAVVNVKKEVFRKMQSMARQAFREIRAKMSNQLEFESFRSQ